MNEHDEFYNSATTWLQLMLGDLEELHEMWELQEHLRLPPWHQQWFLKNAMELWDGIELARDTPPEIQRTRGFKRLRKLWGLPNEIIKELSRQELGYQEPAHQDSEGPAVQEPTHQESAIQESLQTPQLVRCLTPNCDFSTPIGAQMNIALEFLELHIEVAHPKPNTTQNKLNIAHDIPTICASTTIKEDPVPL